MNRIEKDEYYLNIVRAISLRSPCLKAKVGAVIVRNDVIIATGYNGPPRGDPHCTECIRMDKEGGLDYVLCPAVHSEENALINSARQGTSVLDGTIYVAHPKGVGPCFRCERVLQNAGIKRIVVDEGRKK